MHIKPPGRPEPLMIECVVRPDTAGASCFAEALKKNLPINLGNCWIQSCGPIEGGTHTILMVGMISIPMEK